MSNTARRRVFWLVIIAVLVAISGGWVVKSNHTNTTAKSGVGPVISTQMTAQVSQLVVRLPSGNDAIYRSAWAHDNVPRMAPSGTILSLDIESFVARRDYASVNAMVVIPGASPEKWKLLLVLKNGQWTVYAMEKVN